MTVISCTQCHRQYPHSGLPYRCPDCSGVYDFDGSLTFNLDEIETDLSGIWKYRHTFNLFSKSSVISLGEGGIPLIKENIDGVQVWLKMESLNPTGSYKDRGTAVLVSQLIGRNAQQVVEDSSGNAGASIAAYTSRAGLRAKVFVPSSASGPKRSQIETYGAELVSVSGPRSEATKAAQHEAKQGSIYASHAYMPFGLAGIATIAYELWEEFGISPGTVIAPVGHGSLLLGIIRGFDALHNRGIINSLPYFIGVQSHFCVPIYTVFTEGWQALDTVREGETIAEGVRVRNPVRAKALLQEISNNGGQILVIEENAILTAYRELARRGIHVEPTSAIVWSALEQIIKVVPKPIVLIMTGSGLKY